MNTSRPACCRASSAPRTARDGGFDAVIRVPEVLLATRDTTDERPPAIGRIGLASHEVRSLQAVEHARDGTTREAAQLRQPTRGHARLGVGHREAAQVGDVEAKPLGGRLLEQGRPFGQPHELVAKRAGRGVDRLRAVVHSAEYLSN